MYCVYMHKNKLNNKVYIGVTNDIKRRWRQGGVEYRSCPCFYEAICKYGFDSFDHTVLEDDLTECEAFEQEKYYINLYHSDKKKLGYNIAPGGNGGKVYRVHPRNMSGKSQTNYQKEHQSKLMKSKSFNPMTNGSCKWGTTHNHPKGMKGKHHTAEHNRRISEAIKNMNVNCKPIRVIYPDGKIEEYRSTTEAEKMGLTKPVILKIIRSNNPYKIKVVNQYTEKIKHLEGIRIEYI